MKRVMILLLYASIMLSIIPAYAFPGYTDDTEETVNGFASAYGWNTENVDAPTWQGTEEPDQEYGRLQGHQKENYEDLIIADEWQAFELGLIDSVSSKHGGSGAQQMIEVALGELGHDNRIDNRYGSVTGMSTDQPWCCSFISWCAKQCGFLESGLYRNTASCRNMSDYLINTNGFQRYMFNEITQFGGSDYSVVPGDIYIFYNPSEGGCSHIALIAEVTNDSFTTVEGLNWKSSAGFRVGYVGQRTFSRTQLGSAVDTMNGWAIHVEYPITFLDDVDIGTLEGRQEATYKFLRQVMGLNDAGAIGIMANIQKESGFNPLSEYHTASEDSYGICQWNNRWHFWDDCINFCQRNDYDYLSLEGQLYYMQEYANGEAERRRAMEAIRSVPNTLEGAKMATDQWCRHCEKPGNMENSIRERQKVAQDFWATYSGLL